MASKRSSRHVVFLSRTLPLIVAAVFIASLARAMAVETGGSSERVLSSSECPGSFAVDAALAGTEPIFVSDYFSFVGSDEKGRVAFAIDNDRSRRGDKFSADAHVVLHDEREGWARVSGAGDYANKKNELLAIPDSPDFQFFGDPKSGIILRSPSNRLELEVAPVRERACRISGEAVYSLGSTSATMKWKDRVIPGRVIYEYIFMKNLSRWYSAFSGLFYDDFQGLYLMTGDGGDFYFHTSKGKTWSNMSDRVMGFQVLDGQKETLRDLQIEVPERVLGWGFYRWPKRWQVSWQGNEGAGSLLVKVIDQKTVTNWVIGGFAMAVVTGELTYGGKTRQIYGLAELIR